MSQIQLSCETYTWVMPGDGSFTNKLEHIMAVCQSAGFTGIEPDNSFMSQHMDPVVMKEALDKHNLKLSSLAYVEDWLHPQETDEERMRADQWIAFMKHFPETILLSVQMPQSNRDNLRERQDNMISCVNAFSRRAAEQGIICSNHPNSPAGSIFRIESDYEILLEGLDSEACGYCPDVGHIAKGGMDPLSIVKQYRDKVNLVHYKDMYADGRWAATGEGSIDFNQITRYLIDTSYTGWIVMEDECDDAITDPDELTMRDGIYIKEQILPLVHS